MRKISVDDLVIGMITAEDVFNYNDQLILSRGMVLTAKAISKLKFNGIESIRVSDESPAVPEETAAEAPQVYAEPEKTVLPDTASHSEKLQASPEFKEFKAAFTKEVDRFKNRLNDVVLKNTPPDCSALLADTLAIMETGNGQYSIFDMLMNMRDSSDTTFVHSLSVALFCNIFADWVGMTKEEKDLVTLCGLLHDIGNLKIPPELLTKSGALSDKEYEIIKKHPKFGYALVKEMDIDPHIKNAILMHHERCDGSGYPFGLTADKIDPYAKLVAIADVYDAMTSSRSYRDAHSPFRTIEILSDEGLSKYDVGYILTFQEHVMNTFIGNRVRLSDGREGEIVFVPREESIRPTVKCGNEFVDLAVHKDLHIQSLL